MSEELKYDHRSQTVLVKTLRLMLNLFINMLSFLTVFVSLVYACRSEITTFQLHIIFCVLGYQFFMCQGTLVLSKFNSWSMMLSRNHKKHLHVAFQMLGLVLVVIGTFLIMNEKTSHFVSVHGSLGICAVIFTSISILNGLCAYYAFRLSCVNIYWIKLLHYVTGICAAFLSAASLCYGFETTAFKSWVGNEESTVILVIVVCLFTTFATIDFWPPPPPPAPGVVIVESTTTTSPLLVVMNVINSITHMILGAVACSAILLLQIRIGAWSSHFTQHIFLCVFGYVILMSVAIMSYDPNTSWSRNLKYKERRTSHMILQIIGSVLAITGSIIRITNLNNNFQTTHGILGLVAMLMTMLSLVGGFLNLFLSGNKNRLLIKTVHSCFGSLNLVVAFTCLCFAFHNTFRVIFSDLAANTCIALTVFSLVGVILPPTINTFNRIFSRR